MPATLKDHLESISNAPMAEYYDGVGLSPQVLAQKGKELLEACTPKTFKLKGWFDKTIPLVDGYRIIKGTLDETLIEQLLADNGIRLKAWVEICKQRGLYPSEKVSVTHRLDRLVGEVVQGILDKSQGVPALPPAESEGDE